MTQERSQADYLLLTPGPLTTSRTVKEAMLRDVSTWDVDYNGVVQRVRAALVDLATGGGERPATTAVLMQGSGTFAVESALGTALPRDGVLLTPRNGAYGDRIGLIADRLGIARVDVPFEETAAVDPERIDEVLSAHPEVTHCALVHCETTTGMLNPAAEVGAVCRSRGVELVLDAMSSFGGIPMTMESLGADWLISSANKCIQGVPGFGFVLARVDRLAACAANARSVSLDLHAQWRGMEDGGGKWRFTSPTHVVLAFDQALRELAAEGGVPARFERYRTNQRRLVEGMRGLGFRTLLDDALQSPIITSFHDPVDPAYRWAPFYEALKRRGFAIYPGKVSRAATFRIGTIGEVYLDDIERLLAAVGAAIAELGYAVGG